MLTRDFHGIRENLRCAGVDFIQQMIGARHYSLYKNVGRGTMRQVACLLVKQGAYVSE